MEYLAHSRKKEHPAQSYRSHIENVRSRAVRYAIEAGNYGINSEFFQNVVERSAVWHDLGKLDDENQYCLHQDKQTAHHLPINHVDAGTAERLRANDLYGALAVYSHHRGLPNISDEEIRGERIFRDDHPKIRNHTDQTLSTLIKRHNSEISADLHIDGAEYNGNLSVFCRMLLSCLADADHTDTGQNYGQVPEHEQMPLLRAEERLAALDQYVSSLGDESERGRLRREMYLCSRDANISTGFTVCDSPVGSGKTTAVMAHLLQQAVRRKARRIFVVLPYTSIIQQSVEIYRKAVVLTGENPEEVVAELHCRAEFESEDTRYLTALWRAPIIVTTAVAFFETLASNRPAALRRLHELPGSMIFVDESHNALPVKLLPLAWKWMNVLSDEWGCYWVLASGSLVRFWKLYALREIHLEQPKVSELIDFSLRSRLMAYEEERVSLRWMSKPQTREMLVKWVGETEGPRLLIVNTVQTAAVLADDFRQMYGRECVEHLSTALTPQDREIVIKRVKKRLQDHDDTNWTLVATSCVEAGVDFSFRTGFREMCSLLSLLQASGRINRHGIYNKADVWSFTLQDDDALRKNPTLDISRKVLRNYFERGMCITPELSTQSLQDELTLDDSSIPKIRKQIDAEDDLAFKTVNETFEVIDSQTVAVVVDPDIADAVRQGTCDWRILQRNSVSIRRELIKSWKLEEIAPEVYQWTKEYDAFLGYMKGVLNLT